MLRYSIIGVLCIVLLLVRPCLSTVLDIKYKYYDAHGKFFHENNPGYFYNGDSYHIVDPTNHISCYVYNPEIGSNNLKCEGRPGERTRTLDPRPGHFTHIWALPRIINCYSVNSATLTPSYMQYLSYEDLIVRTQDGNHLVMFACDGESNMTQVLQGIDNVHWVSEYMWIDANGVLNGIEPKTSVNPRGYLGVANYQTLRNSSLKKAAIKGSFFRNGLFLLFEDNTIEYQKNDKMVISGSWDDFTDGSVLIPHQGNIVDIVSHSHLFCLLKWDKSAFCYGNPKEDTDLSILPMPSNWINNVVRLKVCPGHIIGRLDTGVVETWNFTTGGPISWYSGNIRQFTCLGGDTVDVNVETESGELLYFAGKRRNIAQALKRQAMPKFIFQYANENFHISTLIFYDDDTYEKIGSAPFSAGQLSSTIVASNIQVLASHSSRACVILKDQTCVCGGFGRTLEIDGEQLLSVSPYSTGACGVFLNGTILCVPKAAEFTNFTIDGNYTYIHCYASTCCAIGVDGRTINCFSSSTGSSRGAVSHGGNPGKVTKLCATSVNRPSMLYEDGFVSNFPAVEKFDHIDCMLNSPDTCALKYESGESWCLVNYGGSIINYKIDYFYTKADPSRVFELYDTHSGRPKPHVTVSASSYGFTRLTANLDELYIYDLQADPFTLTDTSSLGLNKKVVVIDPTADATTNPCDTLFYNTKCATLQLALSGYGNELTDEITFIEQEEGETNETLTFDALEGLDTIIYTNKHGYNINVTMKERYNNFNIHAPSINIYEITLRNSENFNWYRNVYGNVSEYIFNMYDSSIILNDLKGIKLTINSFRSKVTIIGSIINENTNINSVDSTITFKSTTVSSQTEPFVSKNDVIVLDNVNIFNITNAFYKLIGSTVSITDTNITNAYIVSKGSRIVFNNTVIRDMTESFTSRDDIIILENVELIDVAKTFYELQATNLTMIGANATNITGNLGGLFNTLNSEILLVDCSMIQLHAIEGGLLYGKHSKLTIDNCIIENIKGGVIKMGTVNQIFSNQMYHCFTSQFIPPAIDGNDLVSRLYLPNELIVKNTILKDITGSVGSVMKVEKACVDIFVLNISNITTIENGPIYLEDCYLEMENTTITDSISNGGNGIGLWTSGPINSFKYNTFTGNHGNIASKIYMDFKKYGSFDFMKTRIEQLQTELSTCVFEGSDIPVQTTKVNMVLENQNLEAKTNIILEPFNIRFTDLMNNPSTDEYVVRVEARLYDVDTQQEIDLSQPLFNRKTEGRNILVFDELRAQLVKGEYLLQFSTSDVGTQLFSDFVPFSIVECGIGYRGGLASGCEVCLRGTYTAIENATECTECERGYYSSIEGSTTCKQCIGSYSIQGSTSCTTCSTTGFVCLEDRQVQCTGSPIGALCRDGKWQNEDGFWIMPLTNTNQSTAVSAPCSKNRCVEKNKCAPNRLEYDINPMCAKCKEGQKEWSGSCIECNDYDTGFWFLGTSVLIVYLLIVRKFLGKEVNGKMPIVIYFLQMCTLMVSNIGRWMPYVMSFTSLDIFESSPLCIAPWDNKQKIIAQMIAPIITMLIIVVLLLIHTFLIKMNILSKTKHDDEAEDIDMDDDEKEDKVVEKVSRSYKWSFYNVVNSYIRLGIFFLFVFYVQLSQISFESLNCIDLKDENSGKVYHSRLYLWPDVDCESDEYNIVRVLALIIICAFVVPFPIITFLLLRKNAQKSNGNNVDLDEGEVIQDKRKGTIKDQKHKLFSRDFIERYGVVFLQYKHSKYYWEIILLCMRQLIVLSKVLFLEDVQSKYFSFTLIYILFLGLQFYSEPFQDKIENKMQKVSITSLMIISAFLQSYASGTGEVGTALQVLISLFILFPICYFIVCISRVFSKVQRKYKKKKKEEPVEDQGL